MKVGFESEFRIVCGRTKTKHRLEKIHRYCVNFIAFKGLRVFLTESKEVICTSRIKSNFQFYAALVHEPISRFRVIDTTWWD